jgi:hypothetical protein
LFRPPCLVRPSVRALTGRPFQSSERSISTSPRWPGVVGLYDLSAMLSVFRLAVRQRPLIQGFTACGYRAPKVPFWHLSGGFHPARQTKTKPRTNPGRCRWARLGEDAVGVKGIGAHLPRSARHDALQGGDLTVGLRIFGMALSNPHPQNATPTRKSASVGQTIAGHTRAMLLPRLRVCLKISLTNTKGPPRFREGPLFSLAECPPNDAYRPVDTSMVLPSSSVT